MKKEKEKEKIRLWSSPYSNMVRRRRSQLPISKETPYRSTLRDPRGKAEPTIGAGHCKSSQTRLTQWDSYSVRNIENIENIPT
ncbi:hypothetical protein U3516DRAFT_742451 [Neocallimastix sp. 'constans']